MRKTCSKCQQEKLLDCFWKKGKRYFAACKDCIRPQNTANAKGWRAKNREQYNASATIRRKAKGEHIRAVMAIWREKNRVKIRQGKKDDYALHADERAAEKRRLRQENPEYFRAIQQRSHERNRIIDNQRGRDRYWADPEKARKASQTWQHDHPDIVAINGARKRARKANAPVNDLTAAQWRAIKEIYRWRCAYCGKKTVALTQDHIVPLSKGGAHNMENIVPACRSCNAKKGNRPLPFPVQPPLALEFK